MSWNIQTNNTDVWCVMSSITGEMVAKFETENDLKIWLVNEELYKGKLKAIEILMTFPSEWTVNDIRQQQSTDYLKWSNTLLEIDNYDDYHQKIDDKLAELQKQ